MLGFADLSPGLSRRALLGGLALVGLAGASEGETLGAIGRRAGVRFGTAMRAATLRESDLAALIAEQCSSITPELEMKWGALAPERDRRDTAGADALVGFARAHGLRMRGHALLWHDSVPRWFRTDLPWSVVADHIAATLRRYAGAADEWDVINEPIAPDGSGFRASPFLAAYGAQYIARSLEGARAAAPRARLFINEYGVEYDQPEQAARRQALLALVTRLKSGGVPLDGVGIQAHLEIGRPFDRAVFAQFLQALADLGLTIAITELDVKERDYILPAAARDAAVAEHAAPFLEVALAQPAMHSLTCWGLSDRQSWLEVTPADRARYPGAWADGTTPGLNRGLPFDAACTPKPLRAVLASRLAAAGRR